MSNKELKAYEWISLGIFIGILAAFVLVAWLNRHTEYFKPLENFTAPAANKKNKDFDRTIIVHIEGAVQFPGSYHLPANAKVGDLLKIASPTQDARLKKLKKSERLVENKRYLIETQLAP